MNINKFLILGFLVLTFVKGFCQKTYSLEECISTALHNSQLVRSTDIRLKDAGIDVDRATAFKLPSASAGFGHGLNFGRSIDPSTNDFINERITRGGFSAQAFQPLWQAGSTKQSIKQYQYAEEASRWTLKNEQDNLQLQVTLAYLQVLNNKELAARSAQQELTTLEQLNRLKNLNDQGAVLPNLYSDMQGQYALDQMNSLDALQAIKTSKLVLSQLMNIPYQESLEVTTDASIEAIDQLAFGNSNFDQAYSQHALIKSSEFQIKSAEASLLAAKAERYPSFGLGADFGSNYSSAYRLQGDKVGYPKQLSNNFNYATYLSLNIPILDNARVRSNTRKAENAIELAKVNTEYARTFVQQKIEEARLMQTNATERYKVIQSQVSAFSESFRVTEARFNEGAIHSVEYLIVKNNLDRAQNQLIAAKYEIAFRNKILDYYAGIK
ncbi:MAG: TolC family protein [Saprospiraceae bacterium]|nr:TolC family protein [Saprospiraceae bacterium]